MRKYFVLHRNYLKQPTADIDRYPTEESREQTEKTNKSKKMKTFGSRWTFLLLVGIIMLMKSFAQESFSTQIRSDVPAVELGNVLPDGVPSESSNPEKKLGRDYTVHQCRRCRSSIQSPGKEPSFIIAGVHKGGTTALFGNFVKHQSIEMSCCKETNFFSDDKLYHRGLEFYRRHFETSPELNNILTGEGTPNYIRDPRVPARIKKDLPNAKIIISLRDPVERFISHYVGMVENKKVSVTCDQFFENQLKLLQQCENNLDPTSFIDSPTSESISLNNEFVLGVFPKGYQNVQQTARSKAGKILSTKAFTCDKHKLSEEECRKNACLVKLHHNAISRSSYAPQIERYLFHFPNEQISVLQAENLFQHTEETMQDLARFIGAPAFEDSDFSTTFKGSEHSKNPLHETCDRPRLEKYFKQAKSDVFRLVELNWPNKALNPDLWD